VEKLAPSAAAGSTQASSRRYRGSLVLRGRSEGGSIDEKMSRRWYIEIIRHHSSHIEGALVGKTRRSKDSKIPSEASNGFLDERSDRSLTPGPWLPPGSSARAAGTDCTPRQPNRQTKARNAGTRSAAPAGLPRSSSRPQQDATRKTTVTGTRS